MARHIARDIAAALAVLALVFLSYAHQPVSAAPQADVLTAAVTSSFCGDVPEDGKAHAPCHACRIGGGADLPPPCEGQLHLAATLEPVFPERAARPYVVAPPDVPDARGPPRLA